MHKLKWEPEYNCDEKVIEVKPAENRSAWDNPYCDEAFLKFNKNIKTGRFTDSERLELEIKPLKDRNKSPLIKTEKEENNSEKPMGLFDKLLAFANTEKKE
jgi:hypothetical protein